MTRNRFAGLLLALTGLLPAAAQAQSAAQKPAAPVVARVAVASNFADAAKQLAAAYGKQSGHRIEVSAASTGKLYAQIRNGAPFDALLSADAETPRRLMDEGLADAGTLHDYAIGRLVLWSRDPARVKDGETLLRKGNIERLAIANPDLAPYGAAARETLDYLRRWEELRPKLVLGENVAQAAQFATSGDAQGGMIAYSLALSDQVSALGSYALIPADWHEPLNQRMVLLKDAGPVAEAFYAYINSGPARDIMQKYGFALVGE